MKVLALDYGSARTGVAVSDPTGTLARPIGVVEGAAGESGLAELARLFPSAEVLAAGDLAGPDLPPATARTLAVLAEGVARGQIALDYILGFSNGVVIKDQLILFPLRSIADLNRGDGKNFSFEFRNGLHIVLRRK